MPAPAMRLSPEFEALLQGALTRTPRELASDVLALSDFYLAHPGRPTPWDQSFAVQATLAYFMPLNYVRMSAVMREVRRFITNVSGVWDYGSGLGTTQWVLEDMWPEAAPLHAIEVSKLARDTNLKLEPLRVGRWRVTGGGTPGPGAMGVFSYSFLEMQTSLPDLSKFDHLVILEPSTRECGRALMEWRSRLIDQGFTALAPCTHQSGCPLLIHSPRDWCHMRVHFEAPEWWREIESHLPMKNRTLTFSYLVLSKTAAHKWTGATRVIGDTLVEKGKTRQLMCRGPEREFLAWLHKHGEAQDIPHGALIRDLGEYEAKSNEVRINKIYWEL